MTKTYCDACGREVTWAKFDGHYVDSKPTDRIEVSFKELEHIDMRKQEVRCRECFEARRTGLPKVPQSSVWPRRPRRAGATSGGGD